jgi:hypothetical protein
MSNSIYYFAVKVRQLRFRQITDSSWNCVRLRRVISVGIYQPAVIVKELRFILLFCQITIRFGAWKDITCFRWLVVIGTPYPVVTDTVALMTTLATTAMLIADAMTFTRTAMTAEAVATAARPTTATRFTTTVGIQSTRPMGRRWFGWTATTGMRVGNRLVGG